MRGRNLNLLLAMSVLKFKNHLTPDKGGRHYVSFGEVYEASTR